MKNLIMFLTMLLILSCSKNEDETIDNRIIDGSGNVYTEVQIGSQIWLKEDLHTDKYIGGAVIEPKYCENRVSAGYYYSGLIDFDKICPTGYRVPTKHDFEVLIEHYGGTGLSQSEIIASYVDDWNGNPNGAGDGIANQGSGMYWASTYNKNGYHYFYFRTVVPGISVNSEGLNFFFHIKCIKK